MIRLRIPGNASGGPALVSTFFLLALAYMLYGWDRQVMPVELVEMSRALSLTPRIAGLLASIFTLGIAIMSVPAGLVVARAGLRLAISLSMLLFSCGTLLSGLAPDIWLLIIGRIATGMGEAVFSIALFTFTSARFPRHAGTAIGALLAVFGVSMFIGPMIVVSLQATFATWRGPFYLFGALGVLGALMLLIFLPRGSQDEPRAHATPQTYRWLLRPATLATLFVAVVNGVGCYAYMSLFQTYARLCFHITPHDASFALGCFGIGTVLGSTPIGYVLDRTNRQIGLALVVFLTGVTGMVLLRTTLTPGLAAWLSLLLGVWISGVYGNCYALIREQAPAQDGAFAIGVLLTVYYLGAAVAGYLFVAATGVGFSNHAWGGVTLFLVPYTLAALGILWTAREPRRVAKQSLTRC
ncbi:MFS transporter [Asaia astilbis]|uniref:MFS transporter n=1 Tax=Asaia astilbis TaxID=610244 RepID=UPI000472DE5A|nr:MFS transporter [Asaia astilbis]